MTFVSIVQVTVNGIALAMMYILVAMGLSVIFSMLRMITFAHGEIFMLGGYLTWVFVTYAGLSYFTALCFATVAMFVVGVILQRLLWQPMINDPIRCLIMSLSLALIIQGGVGIIFGATDKGIPIPFSGVITIMNVNLSVERLFMIACCFLILIATIVFFRVSTVGLAMRAVALDPTVAALQGVPVTRIQQFGFGLGCALAGFAGGLIGTVFSLTPSMGLTPIIKAFVVVVLGGLGSIPGTILAGFIIGMLDSFAVTFFGSIGNLAAFIIFIVVLLFRPQGLMGFKD